MDDIRTVRLRWRWPHEDDFAALHQMVSDYDVVKWTSSWPYPADSALTRQRCKPMDAADGFSGPVFLGDTLIGSLVCANGEFGYMFAQDHWGQGYATEIGRAAVSRAFEVLSWDRITARTSQENAGSARVLVKLGFSRIGTGQCGSIAQGREVASFEYELTRADWLAANPLRIKTERLEIVELTSDMALEFQALAAPAEVALMMLCLPHPIDAAQAADWIEKRKYTGSAGFCAGVVLADGTLFGVVGIGGEPLSVMYFLGVDYWGKGYASEMMAGFLEFCFDTFRVPSITAQALNTNIASQRVLKKLGFEYVRDITGQSIANLEPETDCEYRLTRERFKARL
jgi:ribosomal-protein-alanine N-acetyltransferase